MGMAAWTREETPKRHTASAVAWNENPGHGHFNTSNDPHSTTPKYREATAGLSRALPPPPFRNLQERPQTQRSPAPIREQVPPMIRRHRVAANSEFRVSVDSGEWVGEKVGLCSVPLRPDLGGPRQPSYRRWAHRCWTLGPSHHSPGDGVQCVWTDGRQGNDARCARPSRVGSTCRRGIPCRVSRFPLSAFFRASHAARIKPPTRSMSGIAISLQLREMTETLIL
ncbi:hypothetical protein LX36DRAFT_278326 [Colletotrichum falcatum]|nr:hypothetical protein LX36DRAFT_278326 [Colletotrichum falcatum]